MTDVAPHLNQWAVGIMFFSFYFVRRHGWTISRVVALITTSLITIFIVERLFFKLEIWLPISADAANVFAFSGMGFTLVMAFLTWKRGFNHLWDDDDESMRTKGSGSAASD